MLQPYSATPSKPLSEREIEVLQLKAGGLNYQAIGEAMGIRWRTAMQHALHARDKLLATNVVEAVAVAIELGLISRDKEETSVTDTPGA